LTRAKRKGLVRRDGGQYFRVPSALTDPRLPHSRAAVDREHTAIATALRQYAAERKRDIQSDEDALALLLAFLEENQIAFLLDDPGTFELVAPAILPQRDAIIVARFITERCLRDPNLASYLNRMLEGFVLQNALLLRDIGSVSAKFQELTVFFDSRFMFAALGLTGEAQQQAALESISLLRATQVRLGILGCTIDEIKRVLALYERKLASHDGIGSLFPGLLTTYFVSHRYTPADLKEATALLERNVRGLGITIWKMPKHDSRFTLDEVGLANRIAGAHDVSENRVVHDVDSIAAVLTRRAGRESDSWDNARFAFVTTTGQLVTNAARWYKDEGGKGVPPAIHAFTLTNLAWLKKPVGAAPKLKLHELVAMCAAALRPTKARWNTFLRHLRSLEQSGKITSDEAVAVVANDLTQGLLLDLEERHPSDEEVEPESLSEIVDRVRQSDRATFTARLSEVETHAAADKAATVSAATEQLASAQAAAGHIEEKHRQLTLHLRASIDRWSSWSSTGIIAVAFIVLLAVTTWGLIKFTPESLWGKLLSWTALGLAAAFGIYRATWGGNLAQWRVSLREAIRRRLATRLLLGSDH
jgi:hypothetical protein